MDTIWIGVAQRGNRAGDFVQADTRAVFAVTGLGISLTTRMGEGMNAQSHPQNAGRIDFGEIATSIGFLLRLAQVKAFEGFYDVLGHHGLKPGEFTVLWLIKLNPGARQGDIARCLRIKPAHMTKLVQRAVDEGRLERHIPENDRRSVRLRVSAAGHRFIEENTADFLHFTPDENRNLSEEEFRMMTLLLQKFVGMEEGV